MPTPLPPEALLAHAAWLRRLASSLTGADADDLVQETWLAALRSPPADDRPAEGWLSQVLRNAGRMRARAEGRRARREAELATVSEATAPAPDVLLARVEAQRRLAELVTELAEPLRGALLLRYFEGLSAAEIARRQGVPAGTVRWRLKEGLDRLRVALDRESGGDRRRWCALLVPLPPFGAHRGIPWTTVWKGMWIMSRATKATMVVVSLLLLAGVLSVGARLRAAKPAARATASASPEAPAVPRPSGPRPAPVTLSAAVAEPDASAPNGAFEGRVIDWASGTGVPRAEVTFSVDGATTATGTDDEGRFRFSPARPGRLALALVTAAEYLPFAPEWGTSAFELYARPGMRVRDVTVYLVPALDYVAAVVDPGGKLVAGATVTLLGAAEGEQALAPIRDHFVSDDNGEVHFHAPDGALLEARHPSYGPGRARFDGKAATSHHLEIRLRPKGTPDLGAERISGRVVDQAGMPVGGATVRADPLDGAPESVAASGRADTDAAGRFTLEGLDPGRYRVAADHAGYAPAMADKVSAGATDVVLSLRGGATLSGRVLAAEGGAPAAAFTVIVARREGAVREVTVAVRAVIDPEGRFAVADLDPGDYRVRASAHAHAPSRPLDVSLPDPPGELAPVTLVLSTGGRLTGKVTEAGGGPLPFARVSIENAFGDASITVPVVDSTVTDAQGDFDLGGVPPGARSIMFGAYQHHIRILSGMSFVDGATVGPITVELTPTKEGETPQIEVVGIGVALHADGDGLRVERVIAGGGAEAAGIVVGDVVLAVDGAGVASLGFDGAIQNIRGPEGSTVRLSVRRASGAVVEMAVTRRRIKA